MFLKLLPGLSKTVMYFQAQVIQDCTTLNRINVDIMNENQQDFKWSKTKTREVLCRDVL